MRGRVKLLPNGPPVPYPVQFRVIGADPRSCARWADEVKAVLRAEPQHARRQRQLERGGQGDAARGRPGQGARARRDQPGDRAGRRAPCFSGTTVGQYRENDKLIDIVLRQPPDERDAISDIGNAYLPTASGRSIPLTQIAKPVFELGAGRDVAREPRLRDHRAGRHRRRPAGRHGHRASCWPEAARAAKRSRCAARATASRWPARSEESSKGQGSIVAGVPIMLFIIFTLLMLQLQSFSRAMLVFLTGPLGIAGVAACAAGAEPAVRLRRAAGRDRADGHDHAQLGDPDRPDRAGPRRAACRPGMRSSSRPCGGSGPSC